MSTDENSFTEENSVYLSERARRNKVFQNYLYTEYLEFDNEVVHDKIYSLACQKGHLGGYGDIECKYLEIAAVVNLSIDLYTTSLICQ